jgi:hypothetical protein
MLGRMRGRLFDCGVGWGGVDGWPGCVILTPSDPLSSVTYGHLIAHTAADSHTAPAPGGDRRRARWRRSGSSCAECSW